MPVYNAAPYVKDSIDSILRQTFHDFEFIIINDGSSDKSKEIIMSFNDSRIIFIDHINNVGIVEALNQGLGIARGKYIARMDNDDIAYDNRLSMQVDFMDNNPTVGVCGTAFKIFGSRTVVANMPTDDDSIRKYMLSYNPFGHPTVLMRKAVIDAYALRYRQDYLSAEDYRMWYDFSKVSILRNLPDVLLYYRTHDKQMSFSMSEKQRSNADKVRILQLTDKGFQLTTEEQNIYCCILSYSPLPQTAAELESWRLVMRKVITQNQKLRVYNESWFDHIFMTAWLEAASRIDKYTMHHLWPLLVEPKPTSNSMGFVTGLRLIIKCLVQWKARPMTVN